METLFWLVIGGAVAWWAAHAAFKSGKREGSRKGYNVGRARERRFRR